MRRLLAFAAFAVVACKSEPPMPAPQPPPPPPKPAVPVAALPTPPPAVQWAPPLTKEEDKALDTYVAFSGDGLVLATAEFAPGAGLPVISFTSATTNTVEKRLVLDTPEHRAGIVKELSDEGFPKPGTKLTLPPGVVAKLDAGSVVVTIANLPIAKVLKPFDGHANIIPESVEVVAMSADGKRVGVRVKAKNGGGEFGPPQQFLVVNLLD